MGSACSLCGDFFHAFIRLVHVHARAHEHNVCLYLCGIYISLNRRKNVDLCLSIAYPNVDKIVSYIK